MSRNGFIIHFVISLKADRPYKVTVVYNLATVVYSDIPRVVCPLYTWLLYQLEALMSPTQSVTLIYYNTAARGLTDIYARLPRAHISVKSRAKLCYNIYVTLCLGLPGEKSKAPLVEWRPL